MEKLSAVKQAARENWPSQKIRDEGLSVSDCNLWRKDFYFCQKLRQTQKMFKKD